MKAEKTRSIRLPEHIWDALDEDAERCRRSSQKQIEALLVTFYELADVEINKSQLEIVGELLPSGNKTIKVINQPAHVEKRKKVS